MLFVDIMNCMGHFNARLDRQSRMVSCFNRRAPECHDAVTHVFVDGAAICADMSRQPRKNLVQQSL